MEAVPHVRPGMHAAACTHARVHLRSTPGLSKKIKKKILFPFLIDHHTEQSSLLTKVYSVTNYVIIMCRLKMIGIFHSVAT